MNKVSTLATQGAERRFERKLKEQPKRARDPLHKVSKYPNEFRIGILMAQDPNTWIKKALRSDPYTRYAVHRLASHFQITTRFPADDIAVKTIWNLFKILHEAADNLPLSLDWVFEPLLTAKDLQVVEQHFPDALCFGTMLQTDNTAMILSDIVVKEGY